MEETWSVGGRGQGSAGIQALGYLEEDVSSVLSCCPCSADPSRP